jgi:hypothetical protein
MSDADIEVLWLRPSTGENVSTRRERIAEHLEDMGIKVVIVDTSGMDSLSAMREGLTGNYDLVVGTVRVGIHFGYLLSKLLRVPFIASVSDPVERQKDDLPRSVYRLMCFMEWKVLRRADEVFFVHPESLEEAEERGVEGVLARNAVNYDLFADPDPEAVGEARRTIEDSDIDIGKEIAIYIGGMTEDAHLSEIVEAAKITPDWEFVFVGKEWGANVSELVSGVENAHFLGAYDHSLIPGFLHHSSAALCLVDNEVPLKVTEYGAAGLPTLGYPGKLKHVFSEDELIYTEPKPKKISEELQKISSDSEYAKKYAENLRSYASENRWEDIAKKYYESIVALTG